MTATFITASSCHLAWNGTHEIGEQERAGGMAIPDYQTLMRPVLRLAAERERPIRECVDLVADEFALSAEERETLLPSGKQTTLANRVHWAVTYMVNADLLHRPRQGVIAATDRGRTVLAQYPERIDNDVLGRFAEFPEFLSRSRAKAASGDGEPAPVHLSAHLPDHVDLGGEHRHSPHGVAVGGRAPLALAVELLDGALEELLLGRDPRVVGDPPNHPVGEVLPVVG